MKVLLIVFSSILLICCGKDESNTDIPEVIERQLVWSQEFDELTIDNDVWTHRLGNSGWGNNEWQNYTSNAANSYIENGNLVIEAIYNDGGLSNGNFTSARMVTNDKFEFKYGRVEARMKMPIGQGIWPAFWMLGADFPTTNWPDCGEIDIMEYLGHDPGKVYGTVHGPGYSGGDGINGNASTTGEDFNSAYHIYELDWTADRIQWFVDGNQFHEVKKSDIPSGSQWIFDQNYFFLLNLAVGGNWPGYPDASTTFPQKFYIDYIKVYQ